MARRKKRGGGAGRGRKKYVIKAHTRGPRGPDKVGGKRKKRVRVRRHRAYRGPR